MFLNNSQHQQRALPERGLEAASKAGRVEKDIQEPARGGQWGKLSADTAAGTATRSEVTLAMRTSNPGHRDTGNP